MNNKQIGSYSIIKQIGAGGMGTVYLAEHKETSQQVALKVLPAALAREEGFVERFNREIASLKQLNNPHVVSLISSGVDDGTYFYAMEYVEGETIADRLRRENRIPWTEVARIALQICSALKAAHYAGIIHRDLKPSNLMLTPDGVVKLTDFGIAKIFAASRLTQTDKIVGTAEYMSPEQAEGRPVTKKSDLYSFGALMYVMLTGRPPFIGKTVLDILRKHRDALFDRPSLYVPELPKNFEDIIVQLMEKDPAKRFADVNVLSSNLTFVLQTVDYDTKEQTMFSLHDGSSSTADAPALSGAAPTVGAGSPAEESKEPHFPGPGGATIMRNLMRKEIVKQNERTGLGALFDNTWVLVGCLVLLVGAILWNQMSPGNDLETDEFANSEPARMLKMATHLERMGDNSGAVAMLNALVRQLGGEEDYAAIRKSAEIRLKRLAARRTRQVEDHKWLKARVQKAKKSIKEQKLDFARQVWSDFADLYESDLSAKLILEELHELILEAERNSKPEVVSPQ